MLGEILNLEPFSAAIRLPVAGLAGPGEEDERGTRCDADPDLALTVALS
jgi:hypothetical protein